MARPRSEDKQQAILDAAIEAVALHGLTAPTTLIAKQAGVAEGTIFRYFPTKDDLLNAVYLHVKKNLRQAVEEAGADLAIKERAWSSWSSYVDWGIAHPHASKALSQLSVSGRITQETVAHASDLFPELRDLSQASARSAIEMCGDGFVDTVFYALADATMSHASQFPERAQACKAAGFAMLWNGMTQPPDN